MKIGMIVDDIRGEQEDYTSTHLAMAALSRGHEVWVMGVGDLALDPDERIHARARAAPRKKYRSPRSYLRDLRGGKSEVRRITVHHLDVLLLRNDPADDAVSRPWAVSAGIQFGRAVVPHGLLVLNDPNGLAKAVNKMYFQSFPEEVRPETLITRDRADIKAFVRERGASAVLKPLQGSGGQSVFLVRPEDVPNLNQMIDAVSRDGYVVVQEYLPAAAEGDLRLFLMNGQPLRHKGHYAAFRRVCSGGDMRSNINAGGIQAAAEITSEALRLAEIVRPQLVQDGIFLAGLDIVGDKLMEINVFSPGGLECAQELEGVNFCHPVVAALERKVRYMEFYRRNFDNAELATL